MSGYRMALPAGTKVSEDRVLRGFMDNVRPGVEAGDPGSIKAYLRAKLRLAELRGERAALAIRLRARNLP